MPLRSSTLFAASLRNRPVTGTMLVANPAIELLPDGAAGPRRFKIKAAETQSRRGLVENLLRSRYGWRGYKEVRLPTEQGVWRFTLTAVEEGQPIGTLTVAFDGGDQPMSVDDVFGPEVMALRDRGLKLCEFTKLAVDPTVGSKRVLATVMHVAYIVAHRIRKCDAVLMEVNPRHVRYYERMLDCRVIAGERINRSVNAPAVLMMVEFSHVMEQIGKYGGRHEELANSRSLYPAFMSLQEEAGVIERLRQQQEIAQRQREEARRARAPAQSATGGRDARNSQLPNSQVPISGFPSSDLA